MHPSRLVVELFGGIDEGEITHMVSSWCLRVLGSPVRRDLFSVEGVGCALGIELQDGRRVVVKVVRPDQPVARLRAAQEVQRVLLADGFPTPIPIAGPAGLANGIAYAEELQDLGMMPNGHLPGHRREMAGQLARLVEICAKARPATRANLALSRPAWADYLNKDLWPVPHRPDADLSAPGEGFEVLDELARVSKAVLCAAGDATSIIGHADWEAQNLRFENDRLAMVYDWESLVVERESVIVGLASAVFCARSEPGLGDVATEAEQDAFLTEYH
ncbi:MAG: phosphotransferase, partial [Chloroflexota bacterium]|nr:phosphotransferase [Chloroflexota bacterium]